MQKQQCVLTPWKLGKVLRVGRNLLWISILEGGSPQQFVSIDLLIQPKSTRWWDTIEAQSSPNRKSSRFHPLTCSPAASNNKKQENVRRPPKLFFADMDRALKWTCAVVAIRDFAPDIIVYRSMSFKLVIHLSYSRFIVLFNLFGIFEHSVLTWTFSWSW